MTLSLEGDGRFRRFSQWGVDSGGLRAASILAVAVLLQLLASGLAWRPGVRVDPVALGVTFCALEAGLVRGLLISLGIGYMADLYSGQPRGLWMAGAVLTYGVLRLFVVRVVGARFLTVAVLSALAASVSGVLRTGLEALFGGGVHPGALVDLVVTALASGGVGFPAFMLFRWASDRFRARDENLFR